MVDAIGRSVSLRWIALFPMKAGILEPRPFEAQIQCMEKGTFA
jgi:hypothetical protein